MTSNTWLLCGSPPGDGYHYLADKSVSSEYPWRKSFLDSLYDLYGDLIVTNPKRSWPRFLMIFKVLQKFCLTKSLPRSLKILENSCNFRSPIFWDLCKIFQKSFKNNLERYLSLRNFSKSYNQLWFPMNSNISDRYNCSSTRQWSGLTWQFWRLPH